MRRLCLLRGERTGPTVSQAAARGADVGATGLYTALSPGDIKIHLVLLSTWTPTALALFAPEEVSPSCPQHTALPRPATPSWRQALPHAQAPGGTAIQSQHACCSASQWQQHARLRADQSGGGRGRQGWQAGCHGVCPRAAGPVPGLVSPGSSRARCRPGHWPRADCGWARWVYRAHTWAQ